MLTARLEVRAPQESDRARFVELFGDDNFMVFSSGALDPESASKRFDGMLQRSKELPSAKQPVLEVRTGVIAGYCGVDWFDFEGEPRLELGYRLLPRARGMGYATEAGLVVLSMATQTFQGELLTIIHPENDASINVAEKLGFTFWKQAEVDGHLRNISRRPTPAPHPEPVTPLSGSGPAVAAMHVTQWLLDADPAIRWQVLRDLIQAPPEQVAAERALVETEGWGAHLLALRGPDGQWDGGACFPRRIADEWRAGIEPDFSDGQPWTATLPTLMLLHDLGLDPAGTAARETIRLVAANCRWEHDGQAFFDGEVEACINGRALSVGSYFGADVDGLATGLLADQLDDGGWNCRTDHGATVSSFDSTICVLEGLLEYELSGGTSAVADARRRGEEYLLERQLFRRRSTGEVPAQRWLQFSWPPRWHFDVLRGLDHFRRTGDAPDPRVAGAIQFVRDKQQPDGTWLLENTHPGETQFEFEDGDGRPSRWNTLRALRVLDWYDRWR